MKTTWPAAAAIARGESASVAAEAAQVSERTVRRWASDEVELSTRVNDIRQAMFEDAAGRLSALSVRAVDRLADLIDGSNPGLSLRACKTILDSATRYRDVSDYEGRVVELEIAMGVRRHSEK